MNRVINPKSRVNQYVEANYDYTDEIVESSIDITYPCLPEIVHKPNVRIKELNCISRLSRLKDNDSFTTDQFLQNAVRLIPPALQYSENTRARIIFNGNKYDSRDFKTSLNRLCVDLIIEGKISGAIEVYILDKDSYNLDELLLKDEFILIEIVAREIGKYLTRKIIEQKLKNIHERLIMEQIAISKKNTALKEILHQIEQEKLRITSSIQANIENIIFPILEKLKNKSTSLDQSYISLLYKNLKDIASPFIDNLESKYPKLLSREIQICNMIKNGLTTKEIAALQDISIETIRSQRKAIRKKLGLTRSKTNLAQFLQNNQPPGSRK